MSISTDPLDLLEQRGERTVALRFADDRLRRLFVGVWRSLPADAHDAVYAALGEGEHVLQVVDTTPANRAGQAAGEVKRFGAHIQLLLDFFLLDDYPDRLVRYYTAHELAHIVLGHLGPARAEARDVPALRLLAHAPRLVGNYYQRSDLDHEAEADKQAAAWGYSLPRKVGRRKAESHISIYTTRR